MGYDFQTPNHFLYTQCKFYLLFGYRIGEYICITVIQTLQCEILLHYYVHYFRHDTSLWYKLTFVTRHEIFGPMMSSETRLKSQASDWLKWWFISISKKRRQSCRAKNLVVCHIYLASCTDSSQLYRFFLHW
jgi:hypothetical protein